MRGPRSALMVPAHPGEDGGHDLAAMFVGIVQADLSVAAGSQRRTRSPHQWPGEQNPATDHAQLHAR